MKKASIRRAALVLAAALAVAGCSAEAAPRRGGDGKADSAATVAAATPPAQCEVLQRGVTLASGLMESSGLAESRVRPGVYWSHNDSGHGPELYAIAANGRLLDEVSVRGASNRDWEDIASGRCPEGTGACLYIADTGDNARDDDAGKRGNEHHVVRLAVLPEPAAAARTAIATEYLASVPGKRTDIEAIAVLPDGRVYLVSKGNGDEIALYRWPTPLRDGVEVTLERVRRLAPEAKELGDRVTGASASPNGRWVAVRTYAGLAFYRTADLLGAGGPVSQLDLESLSEPQGEAVSLADDGTVLLTSEGPGHHLPGILSHLHCVLPR